jgi:hypothetical protein
VTVKLSHSISRYVENVRRPNANQMLIAIVEDQGSIIAAPGRRISR